MCNSNSLYWIKVVFYICEFANEIPSKNMSFAADTNG